MPRRSTVNIRAYNRDAWSREVERRNPWTVPVSPEAVAAARRGEWQVVLTPQKPVPRAWFGDLAGREVLCLASGGGQQGPILAAAGAHVTVFDNSPRQLGQDRYVADRDRLSLRTVEGDMSDLSAFPDGSFDLVFHPVSNVFVAEVRPVWREAFRVLRRGGRLLSGVINPVLFLVDHDAAEPSELLVRFAIPYSDLTSQTEAALAAHLDRGWPLEFGHSLEDLIGGQLEAGFHLVGLYEDADPEDLLSEFIQTFLATLVIKPEEAKTAFGP
jgi:SAM-dependent methyltransferase